LEQPLAIPLKRSDASIVNDDGESLNAIDPLPWNQLRDAEATPDGNQAVLFEEF